jgi:hypothetical protein
MPDYYQIDELPWNKQVKDSILDYPAIKNADGGNDPIIYRFNASDKAPVQGQGVLEMQQKLANVFKYFNFDSIYKPYYIENDEYRKALTSGIYGPKTMEMIMEFQKRYMKKEFNGKWNPAAGFGSFGENTKDRLEEKFMDVRRLITKQRKQKKAESYYASREEAMNKKIADL